MLFCFFRNIKYEIVVGRNQGNKCNFFPLDNLKYFFRPERPGGMNIHGCSDICEGEGKEGGIYMAQWHDIHADIMFVKPEVNCIDEIKRNM